MKLYFEVNEIIKSDPLLCDYGSGDVTNHRKRNKLRHNTHFVEKNFYYKITKSIFKNFAIHNLIFIQ